MFFRLSTLELGLIIFGIVLGTTLLGAFVGSRLRAHAETLREPFGVVQAALLGLVALVLAFGLTMAVGRYDQRRAAVVDDANAIGTTYLRAQTLHEPIRSESLDLLVRYTDAEHPRSRGRFRGARAAPRRSRTAGGCSGSSGGSPARPSPTRRRTARHGSTSRPSTR